MVDECIHHTKIMSTTMDICNRHSELISILRGMKRREVDYAVRDYLGSDKMGCDNHADLECRTKMCDWTQQIVAYCKYKTETVAISTNLLDRFLQETPCALHNRSVFQLASISCLYTAVKIHEPQALDMETMTTLIHNVFTRFQIERMEGLILKGLKWFCHPPTAFAFGHYFCRFVADSDKRYNFDTLYELTKIQLDSMLNDYQLSLLPPSSVALAAMLNVIEKMGSSNYQESNEIARVLSSVSEIDVKSPTIQGARVRLSEGSTEAASFSFQKPKEVARAGSPTTVSSIKPANLPL